jgi:hypothetical protein
LPGRLRHGRIRAETPIDLQVVLVTAGDAFGCKGNRDPERFAECSQVERRRHHADDDVRAVVEHKVAADDAGVGAQLLRPETVPEDDDLVAARCVFVCAEGPSGQRVHAKDIEIAAGDARPEHAVHTLFPGHRKGGELLRGCRVYRAAVRRDVEKDACGHAAGVLAPALVDHDQPFRIGDRKRAQDNRVNGAEHHRRGPHPQRQRGDSGDGEGGAREQLAHRKGGVLPQFGHVLQHAHLPFPSMTDGAALTPRAPQIAEPIERGAARLRVAHPTVAHLAPAHGEMERQFLVDFVVDSWPSKPQRKALAKIHGHSGGQQHL